MTDKAPTAATREADTSVRRAESPERPLFGAWVKWVVIGWIGAITVFHLGNAAIGRSFYRDQHLGCALEYAKGSINLLRPVIVGFNLNEAPTPLEFPLWQAAVALAFKAFGIWFGWANLVSLLFLFSALYPLFKLAERFAGAGTGWWTLLFFLVQPLVVVFAGEAATDGQALAAAIWFLFCAAKLWEEPGAKWLLWTILTGSLSALAKAPFFIASGLGCFLMTVTCFRRRQSAWVYLGIAGAVSGVLFLAWSNYANGLYQQAELPFEDLRPAVTSMRFWYFGDLAYRLSPGVWGKGCWRFLTVLLGSFALAPVLVVSFLRPGASRLARCWLLGAGVATLIFFHLVLHHHHYYLMFAPGVAMLLAQVALHLEPAVLAVVPGQRLVLQLALVLGLVLACAQGMEGMRVILHYDSYPYAMAKTIREHTAPTDKLVIQGGGWGGQLLILSDRHGLSVWNTRLLEDKQVYARLRERGYTKLVMVSESPLLAAIKGSTRLRGTGGRESYRKETTPIVETLPTVLLNEDILIKTLP